ncbi:MAG: cytochrome c [Gammaproteobacteria bacterium]|nr:cytochrome c [Gammaproteobacteria bacterium]
MRPGFVARAAIALLGAIAAVTASAASEVRAGREIYDFHCYQCHGYSGDAQTLTRAYVDPPPRDFAGTRREDLPRERMLASVTNGRAGTAMPAFGRVLRAAEIAAVVDFVRGELMDRRHERTRYHTAANGWPDHERYAAAFPFATGELAITTPPERLEATQRAGRQLYLAACVACHDLGRGRVGAPSWQRGPGGDVARGAAARTPLQRRGAELFAANCAFCHADDGTGRNWIGSFLEPHPRDLSSVDVARMPERDLRRAIDDGVPNSSMPAWRDVLGAEGVDAVLSYVRDVLATGQGPVATAVSAASPPAPQWQAAPLH